MERRVKVLIYDVDSFMPDGNKLLPSVVIQAEDNGNKFRL